MISDILSDRRTRSFRAQFRAATPEGEAATVKPRKVRGRDMTPHASPGMRNPLRQ